MARGGVRPGAGRKVGSTKAEGLATKVVRVSTELPNEAYQRLPELLARIDEWEDQVEAAKARGESLRTYEKLIKLIEEVRGLGY
jgi:phage shock protein A